MKLQNEQKSLTLLPWVLAQINPGKNMNNLVQFSIRDALTTALPTPNIPVRIERVCTVQELVFHRAPVSQRWIVNQVIFKILLFKIGLLAKSTSQKYCQCKEDSHFGCEKEMSGLMLYMKFVISFDYVCAQGTFRCYARLCCEMCTFCLWWCTTAFRYDLVSVLVDWKKFRSCA